MKACLFVFLGGGLGATLRYLLGLLVASLGLSYGFVATLLANVLGCFAIGLLFAGDSIGYLPRELRLLLMVGVCGGFTTYSSFSLELITMLMSETNALSRAFAYLSCTAISCTLSTLLGCKLGQALL